MIHYQLRCGAGHGFDGWFPGSTSFDRQAQAGLLTCPVCARTDVARALMAPRVRTGERPRAPDPPAETAPATAPAVSGAAGGEVKSAIAMPDQMRAVLQRMRAEIERHCEYVGSGFADQARAMHEGEQPHRAIYGESTPEEARALAEDGIEVARIPWVPRADG